MREKLFLVLFLMSVGVCFGQDGWKKEGIKLPPPVCYASHEEHHSFIRPPSEYMDQLKSGQLKKANIEVTYVGFSNEAKEAFQYAVEIWQNLIYSPVPIRVRASWVSLDKNVLGNCGPADYYKNFNSTQIWNFYYPVALVEKMLGEEVNSPLSADIVANFNKDFSWYFGIDGKTPANQFDFVSTVLHELAHGLGFSGFFYSSGGRGGYGSDGAAVFDHYVTNKGGQQLVDTKIFANPSTILLQNLTSGWLDFDTRLAESQLPRLYAPSTWDSGSSIYHLDDATYKVGDPNSLMTPFTGSGEAVHDPGPDALSIMYEVGWKNISIRHEEIKDIEYVDQPININVRIEGDFDLDSTSLFLFYSTTKFLKTDSVLLKATAEPAIFSATINQRQNAEVRYYFSASDVRQRRYVFPSNAPVRYLNFIIGPDSEAPVVKHEPIKYLLTTNLIQNIEAEVTDNLGIKSVRLDYFINGGSMKSIDLKNVDGDLYSGKLDLSNGSVKDGDVVSYRIVTTDASLKSNIGRSPLSGYHTFKIEGFQQPVNRYVNNFNTVTSDFISTDFKVETTSGFDNPALNSPHPYPSPDADNMNFNYTAVLKYPIILKAGVKMSFDEIVLVEPGESGTKYGEEDFFDYVIVEGSKDNGISWKPLVEGYDCRAQLSWENLYQSARVGQNSTAVPTKELYVKREIDLLANGNFVAGDTVQVRFRLFSDPYEHGWGWAIDNLSIQDINTAAPLVHLSSGEVRLFPNPATDRLNLQIQAQKNIRQLVLKARNSSGSLVYSQSFTVGSNLFQTEVDVSNFISGLYLFTLEPEDGEVITRKIIIQ